MNDEFSIHPSSFYIHHLNKVAGEAQGANRAPPRLDQPPSGSVCALEGTACCIVRQTAIEEDPCRMRHPHRSENEPAHRREHRPQAAGPRD